MDKVFLIFPYEHEGNKYIEAYPMHNLDVLRYAPSHFSFTTKPSRNQARKFAYKKYINGSGRGYNKLPASPTITEFFKEHWD